MTKARRTTSGGQGKSRRPEIEADVAAIRRQASPRPSRGHLAWLNDGQQEAYVLHGAVWIAPSSAPLQQGYRSSASPLCGAQQWQDKLDQGLRSKISGPPGSAARPTTPDPLLVVLRAVGEITGPPGRFGDRKVFVAALWEHTRRELPFADVGEFKRWLVRQHQESKLTLARADLVSAMPAGMVSESEIETGGATFHFVRDPGVR